MTLCCRDGQKTPSKHIGDLVLRSPEDDGNLEATFYRITTACSKYKVFHRYRVVSTSNLNASTPASVSLPYLQEVSFAAPQNEGLVYCLLRSL